MSSSSSSDSDEVVCVGTKPGHQESEPVKTEAASTGSPSSPQDNTYESSSNDTDADYVQEEECMDNKADELFEDVVLSCLDDQEEECMVDKADELTNNVVLASTAMTGLRPVPELPPLLVRHEARSTTHDANDHDDSSASSSGRDRSSCSLGGDHGSVGGDSPNEDAVNHDTPPARFAERLLVIAEHDVVENNDLEEETTTEMVVHDFDHCLFHSVMSPSSSTYDKDMAAMLEQIADHVFAVGRFWLSRDLTFAAVQDFAKVGGWLAMKTSAYLQCSRYGKKRVYAETQCARLHTAGNLQCNCPFEIRLRATVREKVIRSTQRSQSRPNWSYPVTI